MIALKAAPPETFDPPEKKGDPLPLVVLRSHLTRCTECTEDDACDQAVSLINVFESGRRYWYPERDESAGPSDWVADGDGE